MRSRRIGILHSHNLGSPASRLQPTPSGRGSQPEAAPGGGPTAGIGPPTEEDLVEEGRLLCREYIHRRLQSSGVLTQRQLDSLVMLLAGSSLAAGDRREASEELQLVGEELEAMYPDLFKNVHRQLNLAMYSEEAVKRTFVLFAEQLCLGGLHWGKIVALFAMAGAFAVDCAGQGHMEYANRIVEAFGSFVAVRLTDWLAQQGGWVFPEVTRNNRTFEDQTAAWVLASFAALAVLIVVLLLF